MPYDLENMREQWLYLSAGSGLVCRVKRRIRRSTTLSELQNAGARDEGGLRSDRQLRFLAEDCAPEGARGEQPNRGEMGRSFLPSA